MRFLTATAPAARDEIEAWKIFIKIQRNTHGRQKQYRLYTVSCL